MAEIAEVLINSYNALVNSLPNYAQSFINIFLLVVLVVIYAVLVWKFYRFIGRKNILRLNLSKYNTSKHPVFTKLLAVFLYLVEYILVLPFLVVIWVAGFASFMILLSNHTEVNTILFLSVTIIAAIRMASYIPQYGQNVAQEIAKILPYTLLAVFVIDPAFFDFSRVIDRFSQLPTLYNNIIIYITFIFGLELILRIFDLIFEALGLHEQPEEETNQQQTQKN